MFGCVDDFMPHHSMPSGQKLNNSEKIKGFFHRCSESIFVLDTRYPGCVCGCVERGEGGGKRKEASVLDFSGLKVYNPDTLGTEESVLV